MEDERRRIFKLLETADNFIKYATPQGRQRAVRRALVRYEKAGKLAELAGATDLIEQVRLRLGDIEKRAASKDESAWAEDPSSRPVVLSGVPEHAGDRVPPGQRVTRGWPVLHEGRIPNFDRDTWSFEINGEVERPLQLSYDDVMVLDHAEVRSDFHCVTGWSKLDNVWGGVLARTILHLAAPSERATHVSVWAEHGYSANLPLSLLRQEDVLLAWRHNDSELEPKHGWPLRLVVPKLYAWKSVKWVRGFTFLDGDRRGFWEQRGYHNRADPWLEERYSFQE